MMTTNENYNMADMGIAERLKSAILNKGTYEEISEMTGISVSTLVRISSGKTEPKLSDIIKISNVTERSMDWICYGDAESQKEKAEDTFVAAADGYDEATSEAHRYIIWNLRTLNREDIQAIYRQVAALSSYRYTMRQQSRDIAKIGLYDAIKTENTTKKEEISRALMEEYGLPEHEITELTNKISKK